MPISGPISFNENMRVIIYVGVTLFANYVGMLFVHFDKFTMTKLWTKMCFLYYEIFRHDAIASQKISYRAIIVNNKSVMIQLYSNSVCRLNYSISRIISASPSIKRQNFSRTLSDFCFTMHALKIFMKNVCPSGTMHDFDWKTLYRQ